MLKGKGKATSTAATPPEAPPAFDYTSFKVEAGNVTRTTLKVGSRLHRVHESQYTSLQFNPGFGNARFSPIKDAAGAHVPTIYAGETFDCAAMESVFHDVSYHPGLKTYDKSKLIDQVYSIVENSTALVLADFTTKPLRKLGIARAFLIDTEKDKYPFTQAIAEAVYALCPDIQGIKWTSRQDDQADAYVLFGDRISAADLSPVGVSTDLTSDAALYARLLDLADLIGVCIVPGMSAP